MGIERVAVTTRLSPENTEFIERWLADRRPYETSESELVDMSVRIVRHLVATGRLSLSSQALQEFFGHGANGANGKKQQKRYDVGTIDKEQP